MKSTSPTEKEIEILLSVKREMALPRRSASVRQAEEDEAAVKALAVRSAKV